MKKILSFILCVALLLSLVACADKDEERIVMQLSLNPEVEFILDGNGKVLSANALNEEGNLIVSAEDFVGMDGDEASARFVEMAEELGFLVSGEEWEENNEIRISVTGTDEKAAEKLANKAEKEMKEVLLEAHITAAVIHMELTRMTLEALAAECAPYMDAAAIAALEQMELIELLYASRKETHDLYSQELKNAYYEAKAFALERAKLDVLKNHVSGVASLALELSFTLYDAAITALEEARITHLVSENSLYQKALAHFREAKVTYLNYRANFAAEKPSESREEVLARLELYEKAVISAEEALLAQGEIANAILDELKNSITEHQQTIVSAITSASVTLNDHLTEVSARQTEAAEAFFTQFETDYAAAIVMAKADWLDMKAKLEVTVVS